MIPAEPKVPQGRLPSAFSALARRIDGLFTLRESAAYAGRTLLGVETLEQRALFSVTPMPLDPTHLVHVTGPDGGPSQPSENPIVTQVGNLNDLQDKSGGGGGVPSLPVESANRPPILAGPGPQSGAVGDTVSLVVAGSDADADRLTYRAGGTLPAGLSLDASTGAITGTLTAVGAYAVAITADDGRGGTATAYFSWGVADNATPTTTTLVATQGDPEDESQPAGLTLTATVAGSGSTSTGMVYFYDNGAVVGMASVNAAGVAACTVVNPTDGTHVLTAVYQGNATYYGSASNPVTATYNLLIVMPLVPIGTDSVSQTVLQTIATGNITLIRNMLTLEGLSAAHIAALEAAAAEIVATAAGATARQALIVAAQTAARNTLQNAPVGSVIFNNARMTLTKMIFDYGLSPICNAFTTACIRSYIAAAAANIVMYQQRILANPTVIPEIVAGWQRQISLQQGRINQLNGWLTANGVVP